MGRNLVTSYETKVSAIEAYENNIGSIRMVADLLNVSLTIVIRT